jgi:hypothetical protein
MARRVNLPAGLIIAVRMGDANDNILDYFLLPTVEMTGQETVFGEESGSS